MLESQDKQEFQKKLRRLEELLAKVEHFTDPAVRTHTREIVQAILELHGTGLNRMLERLHDAGEIGQQVIDACGKDEVVSGLLMLHDLHPLSLDSRVKQALESVRPYMSSHGGNVELLEISENGVIRLRLEGSCHGCPSSAVTLKQTIETAIWEHAPDATAIEVEGEETAHEAEEHSNGRFSLPILAG